MKSILSLYTGVTFITFKKQNILLLIIKFKKPYSGPIFRLFCPQNPKTRILSAVVTSCQKSKNFNALIYYKLTEHFFCPKTPIFFQKNLLRQFLSLYAVLTSCKKVLCVDFSHLKTLFWANLAQTKNFTKNSFNSF